MQYVLLACGFVACCSLLSRIVGATVYDIRDIQRLIMLKRLAKTKRFSRRPLVTIFIHSKNNQDTMLACLRSIAVTRYRKTEIIVVDSNSADNTKKIIREYAKQYPKKRIRLVAQRTSKDFVASIVSAKKYVHGDIVITADATRLFDESSILTIIQRFNASDSVRAIVLHKIEMVRPQVTNLLERYLQLILMRTYKLRDSIGQHAVNLQTDCAYQAITFSNLAKNPTAHVSASYVATAVLYSSEKQSLSQLITNYWHNGKSPLPQTQPSFIRQAVYGPIANVKLITNIVWPFIVLYCGYVAIVLGQPTLLIAVLLFISASILHAIWNDTHSVMRQKISYTFGLPITFSFSFIAMILTSVQSVQQIIIKIMSYKSMLIMYGKQ